MSVSSDAAEVQLRVRDLGTRSFMFTILSEYRPDVEGHDEMGRLAIDVRKAEVLYAKVRETGTGPFGFLANGDSHRE